MHERELKVKHFQLIDGDLKPGAYEGRICGKDPPPPMVTQSNIMYILFHSSEEKEGTGFLLNYNFTQGKLRDYSYFRIVAMFYLVHDSKQC